MASRTIETTAVFQRVIQEYDLQVRHDGGEGQIAVNIDGSNYAVLNSGDTYSGKFEQGTQVELGVMPDNGWEVDGSPDTSFYLGSNRSVSIQFVETSGGGGGGETGNPYGISDDYWNNVLQSGVRDFLSSPASYDKGDTIVFGFAGWWNDDQLERNNLSASDYAQNVAQAVLKDEQVHNDVNSCLVNVHWVGAGGFASTKDLQALLDKIENW